MNEKSNEEIWREEWFSYLVRDGQMCRSVDKDNLFKAIDDGISGWRNSLLTYTEGRREGLLEVEKWKKLWSHAHSELLEIKSPERGIR